MKNILIDFDPKKFKKTKEQKRLEKLFEYKEKKSILNRKEIICLALAVKDAYPFVIPGDFCKYGFVKCGQCRGCIRYKNIKKAYEIAEKFLEKI
jgi:hypothetical protein